MRLRTLSAIGLAIILAGCSGQTASGPSSTPSSPRTSIAYQIQAFVSQGSLGSIRGVRSPAIVDFTFRTQSGESMDIVSATLTLQDDGGAELARQTFGPSAGLLSFRPRWEDERIGRTVRFAIEVRAAGTVQMTEFSFPL
jgi:hypothetical protein